MSDVQDTSIHTSRIQKASVQMLKAIEKVLPAGATKNIALCKVKEATWHANEGISLANGDLPKLARVGRKPKAV